MKKSIFFLVTFLVFFFCFALHPKAETESGYWVLTGTNKNEAESVNEGHVKANENITAHSYEIHPGGGSMSTTTSWPDGHQYTIKGSFSFEISDKIKAGEKFSIKLKAFDAGSDNREAYISHGISAELWVRTGQSWMPYGSANAATEIFVINENPPKTATMSETVTDFIAPTNADGFTVIFKIQGGGAPGPMVMNYDYEYSENSEKAPISTAVSTPETEETTPEPEESLPTPSESVKPTPTESPETQATSETPAKNPELTTAGCVFSDLSGQIEVSNPIGYDDDGKPIYDEDAWNFAKMDEPLYADTKIRTGLDSSAILSFADMSTFVMKPSTTIILSSPLKKQNMIKLAAGNIWANVKKMIKDGSMDIEMSQAAASIKGTIFICEEKDGTSTLKVIEGEVQFTDLNTGKTTMVSDGKMIAAGAQMVPLSKYNIKGEHKDWQKYDSDIVISNKPATETMLYVSVIILFSLVCVAFLVYKARRKKS